MAYCRVPLTVFGLRLGLVRDAHAQVFMHATCAHKYNLLFEAHSTAQLPDTDSALDPYRAFCSRHTAAKLMVRVGAFCGDETTRTTNGDDGAHAQMGRAIRARPTSMAHVHRKVRGTHGLSASRSAPGLRWRSRLRYGAQPSVRMGSRRSAVTIHIRLSVSVCALRCACFFVRRVSRLAPCSRAAWSTLWARFCNPTTTSCKVCGHGRVRGVRRCGTLGADAPGEWPDERFVRWPPSARGRYWLARIRGRVPQGDQERARG